MDPQPTTNTSSTPLLNPLIIPNISRQSATPPSESTRTSPTSFAPNIAVPTLARSFTSLQGGVDCRNLACNWLERDGSNWLYFCKDTAKPDEPRECDYFATCGQYIQCRPSANSGEQPPRMCYPPGARLGDAYCATVLCAICFESVVESEKAFVPAPGHYSWRLHALRVLYEKLKRERQLREEGEKTLEASEGSVPLERDDDEFESERDKLRKEIAESKHKSETIERELREANMELDETRKDSAVKIEKTGVSGGGLEDAIKGEMPEDDLQRRMERIREEIRESEKRSKQLAADIAKLAQ